MEKQERKKITIRRKNANTGKEENNKQVKLQQQDSKNEPEAEEQQQNLSKE